jgi:tetratricopeptide (TPR) repeat protein
MRINSLFVLALLIGIMPRASAAQQRPLLDQADGAISNGTLSEARSLLERWRRENPRPDDEQQARYHLLAARVTMSGDSAEDRYLNVAVNFSTSRVAPEALLRLAQARYARGDTTQATEYLERLLSDYPNADQRPMAAIWLARVQAGARSNSSLCQTLRAVQPGTNPETIDLLKGELQRVCGTAAGMRTPEPRVVRTDAPPTRPQPVTPTPSASNATGKVSIQVGAFRDLSGARELKAQIERAGISSVRLVRTTGSNLIRVRVGRYANRTAAAPTLERLASADISAVLVTDADAETVVKN